MDKKHWEKEKLWAGLNRPDLKTSQADIVIFGIPYDGSVSFRSGAKEAPNALREITYTISPTTEGFKSFSEIKIKDVGDIIGETREDFFQKAMLLTEHLAKEETFFIMIGGDHSVTIPVQKGVDKAVSTPFGIIHIDAHFDLCNDQDGNRLSHGSTARRAVELIFRTPI